MKTKVFFGGLILFFFSFSSFSQPYNKLVIENAQWRVLYDDDATPWPDAMQGWLLRGDTIINNLKYKILYVRAFEDPFSNVIISQSPHGFLREDTINKIIYAYGDQWMGCDSIDEEFILFDFSYEIGDTSQLCSQTEMIDYCIIMDTFYQNMFGADRKILVFDNGSCNFIEGIGHDQGLLESPVYNISGGVTTELYDYCVGTDEECNVLYVKVDEPFQTVQYQVYPNPCRGSFFIKSNSQEFNNIIYSVTDLYGRVINYDVKPVDNHIIQINLFNPGIYLLNLCQPGYFSGFREILNIY